ncbi:Tigger transposable element-derived protein 1, partial [Trichinella zimbabwensis]
LVRKVEKRLSLKWKMRFTYPTIINFNESLFLFVMDPKGTSVSGDGLKRQKRVGRVFGISESTAHYIHKNEKALTTKAGSQGKEKALIKMENALYIWLDNQKRKRVPVDSNAIRKKARVLYGRLKQAEPSTSSRSTFAAGKGWFDHIIRRSSLRNVMMSGEAASADQFGQHRLILNSLNI